MDDQSGGASSGGDASSVSESPQRPAHWPPGATEADVAEARRLYELTGTPVEAIRERFKWSAWQLRKLREREGWTTRPSATTRDPLRGLRRAGADAVEFRMNRLIVFGIGMLEQRAATDGFDEQNARTLVALCRAQEIMMRADRMKTIREKKNKNDGTDFRDDPLWLAAEFARRISSLHAPEEDGAGSLLRELDDPGAEDVSR